MALRVSVSKHILDSFVLLFIPRARKSINAKIPRASTLMPYLRLSKAITVTVSAINQCVLIYHYYLFSKTADLSNPEESFFSNSENVFDLFRILLSKRSTQKNA